MGETTTVTTYAMSVDCLLRVEQGVKTKSHDGGLTSLTSMLKNHDNGERRAHIGIDG